MGQTQTQAQTARDDGANSSVPTSAPQTLDATGRIVTQQPTATPSNAAGTQVPPTTGVNDPTRSNTTTQTVPPITAAPGAIPPGSPSAPQTTPSAPVDRGTAANNDDNTNGVVSRINDIFGGNNARIVPQSNVLGNYSSYTYNISIYLTTSQEYRSANNGQRPNLAGSNLLMQSGGANLADRNQEFPLDFYIDDLRINSLISGKGTGGGHNAVDLSFRVYEPYGVTFLDRLATAVRKYVRNNSQANQTQNYAAQAYLMVIKFYGYDDNGELVRVANALQTPGAEQEPGLIVEKYIPFRFTQIKFRLAGRTAEYECNAVALRDYAPPSQTRGIIPYNVELTAITLQELLAGNLSFSNTGQAQAANSEGRTNPQSQPRAGPTLAAAAGQDPSNPLNRVPQQGSTPASADNNNLSYLDPVNLGLSDPGGAPSVPSNVTTPSALPNTGGAPPKASAAPKPSLVAGLTAALNEFQAELVKNGTYQHADVYDIKINESILREALLQPPEAAAGLRSVPMTAAQSAAAQKLGAKQSVDRNSKNVSATAGMSIVQFLDQIVRNSSYIIDQQTKIYTKDSAGEWVVRPRSTGGTTFAWYRIGMDAEPIRDKYDEKRRDYAYRITYTITPYQVNDSKSPWFPQSRFQGTHKKYEYWFTGLNTDVINYEQDYNYLYYIAINGGQGIPSTFTDYREYEQYAFQARAPEASQGAAGPVFDPPAQAAAALYSPGDTAKIKMEIIGDPAWLQQGEIVSGIPQLGQVNYGPFLPDGTINYDSREILFEVTFNTAGDYNLETGLMDVERRSS